MIDRRAFVRAALSAVAAVVGLGSWGAWVAWPLRARADEAKGGGDGPSPSLLEKSPYVYVSPLKSDGAESRCHAEVWYAWIDGAVVMTVSSDGWKARAIGSGLDRARIWVGDHGRLKGIWSLSTAFREAPHFDVRGVAFQDEALLERLLAVYAEKYPDEIDRWADRMRKGHADGSRILIRYEPIAA